MSEPLRQMDHADAPDRAPQTRTRRPRRLARWLSAIVALLIVLAVLGALAVHQLALTNQAVGRVSDQLNHASQQSARFQLALFGARHLTAT